MENHVSPATLIINTLMEYFDIYEISTLTPDELWDLVKMDKELSELLTQI